MSKTDFKRLAKMRDEDIDYSDIPPSTDEELAAMRPLREVFPDLAQSPKRVTLQLDHDIVQWFKQSARAKNGNGYHTLINAALRAHIARQKKPLKRGLNKRSALVR